MQPFGVKAESLVLSLFSIGGTKASGYNALDEKRIPPMEALLASQSSATSASGAHMLPKGADPNIIRSGHWEIDTLLAPNNVVTEPVTVNILSAPNNSTMQCGCEDINCPMCNLMLNIEWTDPNVLQ